MHSSALSPTTNMTLHRLPRSPRAATASMSEQTIRKRPTCPTCTKPTRFCLCTRIRSPLIDSKIRVTILQHRLESKHPLNTARIATLGLKNVILHTVSDVESHCQYVIQANETGCPFPGYVDTSQNSNQESGNQELMDLTHTRGGSKDAGKPYSFRDLLTIVVQKHGEITSLVPAFRETSETLAGGFAVKKLRKTQSSGERSESEYCEEFEIAVPAGSVLLYPSEKAVSVEEMKVMNKEISNLIVLDATWSKARRIYRENPWLDLLPHLRLDADSGSLYREVRKQPKGGCLSTIESVVYALKAMGENDEGLHELLDVFTSMIGYQRRCKDERLKTETSSPSEM